MKPVLLKRIVFMGIIVSILFVVSKRFQNEVIHLVHGSLNTGVTISVDNTITGPRSWNTFENFTLFGNTSSKPSSWLNIQNNTEKGKTNKQPVREKSETDKSLNKTIPWTVLITVNNAFFDFYQNWLWHYQQLNFSTNIPIVIVAEDDEMYRKVETLNTSGVTVKKSHLEPIKESLVFNTPLFKKYMSRRAVYIQDYLQKGIDVLHVDVDSVWLKNPFPYLVGDFDIWGQVDRPAEVICIGLIALKSNDQVKSFVKSWIDAMQDKANTKADQEVFNNVLRPRKKLRIKKLPNEEFPSGKLYFENFNNATRAKTVVVHNNWVIGHDKKKNRFIKFNLWKV